MRNFLATVVLSRPVAQASTIRARRANCGAVRARCAIESSTWRWASVTVSGALGPSVDTQNRHLIDT